MVNGMKNADSERGAIAIQVAIILPILIIAIIGMFEVWRVLYMQQMLNDAVYQGVRLMATQPNHENMPNQVERLVRRYVSRSPFVSSSLRVNPDSPDLYVSIEFAARCGAPVAVSVQMPWYVGQGWSERDHDDDEGDWLSFMRIGGVLTASRRSKCALRAARGYSGAAMIKTRPSHLGHFARDQRGSELVEFVLVLPLLIAVVWGAFEIYQLVSLRSVVRTTATQLAHYVGSYGAPYQEADYVPDPDEICAQLNALAASSLADYQGPLGDSVTASASWYRILDPHSSRWEGNIEPVQCYSLIADQIANRVCNEQFAVVLNVSVPWQTVIFGLDGNTIENWDLSMSETAMSALPCMPYFTVDAGGGISSGGPEGLHRRGVLEL